MQRKLLVCILILSSICVKADKYDQQYFNNATTIQLEKTSSLGKALGKDVENITTLQIKGELSDKDMKTLSKLTNLKRLSIRYSNIGNTKSFPLLPNLEVLFLPDNQHLPIEYMDMIPANKKLQVLLFCSFLDIQPRVNSNSGTGVIGELSNFSNANKGARGGSPIYFAPFTSLKKVIITNMLDGKNSIDYQTYGVAGFKSILVDTLIYECPRLKYNSSPIDQQFAAKYFEGENGHLFYVGKGSVDFSTIQAVKEFSSTQGKINIPPVLNLKSMTYVEKGFFNDSGVEEITFSANSSLEIKPYAFKGAQKLKKIVFANSLKNVHIYEQAFSNCQELETIVFDCPVTIESTAFSNYENLKEVIFNQKAVIRNRAFYAEEKYRQTASVKKVIFNSDVNINNNGFQYVDEIIFNSIPTSLTPEFAICHNIQMPKIEGAYIKFSSFGINPEHLIDPLANLVLDIVVTEPGNILKFMPIDKLPQIKSLTVTGHIYDTDIAIIKQCTNLQYLNIANTYISESPSTQERRQAENEMWTAFAELSIADAQIKEATGELKKREAKQLATEAVLAAAMMQAQNPEMPDCYIPSSAFANMLRLSEVVLPIMVKRVNGRAFKDCTALQKIELGNALEEIGREAFANTKLANIKFPETLKSIHVEAFENIETLNVLDFSNCTMVTTYGMIYDYYINHEIGCVKNVQTIYMPMGMKELNFLVDEDSSCLKVKDLYVGKDVNNINRDIKNVNLHFQTELAPEFGMFGKVANCTIYVPVDANITSYYAKFNGNGNKIIQE